MAIGSTVLLAEKQIAGVVNILPFTCMPGTINCTVSHNLRKKFNGLPWENFAYDGHDNIGLDTRFEAFMYQPTCNNTDAVEREIFQMQAGNNSERTRAVTVAVHRVEH